MQGIAYYHTRCGIGDKGQVCPSHEVGDIGDVRDAEPAEAVGLKLRSGVEQVRIDEVVVVGTRSARTFPHTKDKAVGAEQVIALFAAYGEFLAELTAAQFIKLTHACTGQPLAKLIAVHHDTCTQHVKLVMAFLMLVVALSADAKITAEEAYVAGLKTPCTLRLRQGSDYLAPEFFRIRMWYLLSARSIIISLAMFLSFSSLRSFSACLSSLRSAISSSWSDSVSEGMSCFFISSLIWGKSGLPYLRSHFIRFITHRSWRRLNAVFDKPLSRYCRNNDNFSSSVYVFILFFIEEN